MYIYICTQLYTYIYTHPQAQQTAGRVDQPPQGITPRSIIMASTTDHLTRVSKDLLNPRRLGSSSSIYDTDMMYLTHLYLYMM